MLHVDYEDDNGWGSLKGLFDGYLFSKVYLFHLTVPGKRWAQHSVFHGFHLTISLPSIKPFA